MAVSSIEVPARYAHVVVASGFTNEDRLPVRTALAVADELVLSVASVWEIAIKVKLGKLTISHDAGLSRLDELRGTTATAGRARVQTVRKLRSPDDDPPDYLYATVEAGDTLLLVSGSAFRANRGSFDNAAFVAAAHALSRDGRTRAPRQARAAAEEGADGPAYAAAPPAAEESSSEEEPLAWDAEGWEAFSEAR